MGRVAGSIIATIIVVIRVKNRASSEAPRKGAGIIREAKESVVRKVTYQASAVTPTTARPTGATICLLMFGRDTET